MKLEQKHRKMKVIIRKEEEREKVGLRGEHFKEEMIFEIYKKKDKKIFKKRGKVDKKHNLGCLTVKTKKLKTVSGHKKCLK